MVIKQTLTNNLKLKGELIITIRDAKTNRIKDQTHYKNLVVNAGLASIAAALRGSTASNKGIITYLALGDDNTTPESTDTTLGNETIRKLIADRYNLNSDSKVAVFRAFFNTSEANDTHLEAGLFGDDATGTADSGTLFCHTAINKTKTSADTMTIEWRVTIGV